MALVQREHCGRCDSVTIHINGTCRECASKDADRKRREHFGKLNALTIEERLRLIEEWQYQQQINPPWIGPSY